MRTHRALGIKLFLLFFLGVCFLPPLSVLAITYQPGETLDPACLPTDINCTVATSTSPSFAVTQNGLAISSSTPASTTNTLYNQGGVLYWNGSPAGSSLSSTDALAEGVTNLYFTAARWAAQLAGTTTTALAEGTNLYFTNARADSRFVTDLAATSSISSITTLANLASAPSLSLSATQLTNLGVPFYAFFNGTTTDALTQGTTNKYYSDALVQSFINTSSTIPKTYTANTFTNSNAFNGGLMLGTLNGPLQANGGLVSATTSIGVSYGGTGLTSAPSYGNILVGNSSGGYTLTATSSLGLGGSAGTVTSVALTAPTGLTITGSPITTSGTLALSLTSGYLIPLTASTTEYDNAYANRISSASSPLSITNHVISLSTAGDWTGTFDNQEGSYYLDARNVSNFGTPFFAFFSATTTDALSQGTTNKYYSTNLFAGSLAGTTTTALLEGTNLYFTNARADARINATSSIGTLSSAPSLGTISTALTGIVKATAGVLSTTLINFASDITGILPVGNGGTGWGNIAASAIPYGNGSSALSTTTAGSAGNVLAFLNGIPTWTATTTFSSPLSYTGGTVSIAAANASTNGYLTSTDWATFNTKFATTSTDYWLTTKSTSHLAEGSSLYYTDTRVGSYISASSTVPHTAGSAFGDLFSWTGSAWSTRATSTLGVALSDTTGTLAATHGGTGLSSVADGSLVFGSGSTALTALASSTGGTILQTSFTTGRPTWVATSSLGITSALVGTTGQVPYFSGTNTAVGTSSLLLATSGNVGVGSTTPWAKLSVTNIGTGPSFVVEDSASPDTTPFIVDANGFVGIGTSSPSKIGLTIENTSYGGINLSRTAGNTGYWGIGIGNAVNEFIVTDWMANADRLVIDGSGNVGIGTISPAIESYAGRTYLTIKGPSEAGVLEFANGAADGQNTPGVIQFTDSNSTATDKRAAVILSTLTATTPNKRGGNLVFYTRADNANSLALRMFIADNGNVGVGTTTPGSLLSVGNTSGINFGAATSTFSTTGGVNITSGCFAKNSVCIGGSNLQSATSYKTTESATAITTSTTTLTTLAVTPNTATGDVFVQADIALTSGGATDQADSIAIRKTDCTGTLLQQTPFAIQASSNNFVNELTLQYVEVNAGASSQTYALCISNSAGITNVTGWQLRLTVIDTGADMAEVYTTNDQSLEAGDVVSLDQTLETGVKKSTNARDQQVVGIVSTNPGMVIGGVRKEGVQALPVALAGRVPVKVNTDNGAIVAGDYLTPSSIPGVAMKSDGLGLVIGQAMVAYSGEGVGMVTVFIKNFDRGQSAALMGDVSSASTTLDSIQSEVPHDPVALMLQKITGGVQFLTDFVAARVTAVRGYFDEIFAKKVHSDELCLKKSDGAEVCVNGDQLQAAVGALGAPAPTEAPSASLSQTPPAADATTTAAAPTDTAPDTATSTAQDTSTQ